MIVSLALVVFGSSIAVFFSEEWVELYKKIITVPGLKLLIPLTILSWLIEKYEKGGYWFLFWCQAILQRMEQRVRALLSLPLDSVWHIERIIYLCLFALTPVVAFWLIAKCRRNDDAPWPYAYRIGIALWVLAAILFTLQG